MSADPERQANEQAYVEWLASTPPSVIDHLTASEDGGLVTFAERLLQEIANRLPEQSTWTPRMVAEAQEKLVQGWLDVHHRSKAIKVAREIADPEVQLRAVHSIVDKVGADDTLDHLAQPLPNRGL